MGADHGAGGLKSRSYGSFGSRGGVGPSGAERGTPAKPANATHLYRVVIVIVGIFFLMETIGNGVAFLRLREQESSSVSSSASASSFTSSSSSLSLGIFVPKVGTKAEVAGAGAGAGAVGGGVRFVPRLLLLLSRGRASLQELRGERRAPVRPARLALVCPNLSPSPLSLYMVTTATGLQELGYSLEVHTLKDGPLRSTWEGMGTPVKVLKVMFENATNVDWLNYEGVIAFSFNAKPVLDSLALEPFTGVPVIWAITDDALGRRLGDYEAAANSTQLISNWRQSFKRANIVVFPDYTLPLIYTMLDSGNFFVIPGSPDEPWTAEEYQRTHSQASLRAHHAVRPEDLVVAVVGSPFLYHGSWREHALVMRALATAILLLNDPSLEGGKSVQLFVVGRGNHSSSYGSSLQAMAAHLGLENAAVRYVGAGDDVTGVLWMSDAVVYGSFRDEQAIPPILSRAMCLGRPVIAPNQSAFREHIVDGENGVLFPVGDDMKLAEAIARVVVKDGSVAAMALRGQSKARNMFASNVSLSYGRLLESVLEFPSEAELPRPLDEAAKRLKGGWSWDSFQAGVEEEDDVGDSIIKVLEDEWALRNEKIENSTEIIRSYTFSADLELPSAFDLEQAKAVGEDVVAERIEQEELNWRKEQVQIPLEDISKMIRKTEVRKDELKERSDVQLHRGAQSLCIYEPYHGRGAWPFLHVENPLYRGLSLSTVDRRPGDDDVDAEARLPGLLNETYYRYALCDYGALFAIANRIDLIHKNPWIGFQPWRTSSKGVALTPVAEAALTEAVNKRRDGDALYFWARTDGHAGTSQQDTSARDFWAYCDSITSGQCREAYAGSWRHMYGLRTTWAALPPMPADGGAWSALHSWVMPTSSFVEFILFARMFVDALHAQYYEEHYEQGKCRFARFERESQHCYCGVLEGLVNVWAYHSARRMVYVNPESGAMEEQHALESRRGKTWVHHFRGDTLKGMDEDLAQAADDSDVPREQWLWPRTGEVFWQGIFERERQERWRLKMERKQKQLEKQALIRSRLKQEAIH